MSYNWGRWIAACPSPVCLGVIEVRIGQTTVVCDCRDSQICQHDRPQPVELKTAALALICGNTFTLQWPDAPDSVESICSVRPVRNRNWHPGETLDDLRIENELHGVA